MFQLQTGNFKRTRKTNDHNVAVNMEVQLGLTAIDGDIESALKEVLSAEQKAFIGHLKCTCRQTERQKCLFVDLDEITPLAFQNPAENTDTTCVRHIGGYYVISNKEHEIDIYY